MRKANAALDFPKKVLRAAQNANGRFCLAARFSMPFGERAKGQIKTRVCVGFVSAENSEKSFSEFSARQDFPYSGDCTPLCVGNVKYFPAP